MIMSKTLRRVIPEVATYPEPYYGCNDGPCGYCKRRWEARRSAIVSASVYIMEHFPNIPNKEVVRRATDIITFFDCSDVDLERTPLDPLMSNFVFYSDAEAELLAQPTAGHG